MVAINPWPPKVDVKVAALAEVVVMPPLAVKAPVSVDAPVTASVPPTLRFPVSVSPPVVRELVVRDVVEMAPVFAIPFVVKLPATVVLPFVPLTENTLPDEAPEYMFKLDPFETLTPPAGT